MKKKGFIYMSVVLVFLAIMMSVFYTREVFSGEQADIITSRIKTMNSFVEDLSVDADRAGYISGFRALLSLEEYISTQGVFLTDVESSFKEAFYNGTIGNYTPMIMIASSFSEYIQRVNQKAGEVGINIIWEVTDLRLSQSDPWTVVVDIDSNITVNDARGLASWTFNKTLQSSVSIYNLKDPLYSVNTLGRVESFIQKTNITEFVVNNQTDNLIEHIENSYYRESSSAPSFIMRFEGDLSSSSNGIESLVDISFLEKQEDIIVKYDRSIVDYIYFGSQTTNNSCSVQNMPSWFEIDDNHIIDYEIDELSYSSC